MISKRIQYSLSAKLFILFIFSGAVLILLVGSIMGKGFSSHFRDSIQPFMLHYIALMDKELGTPPSLEKARRIADEIPINIHVFGPDQNWSTGKRLDLGALLDHDRRPEDENHRSGPFRRLKIKRIDDDLILQTRSGNYDIYFELHHRQNIGHGDLYSLTILAAIFGVLVMMYYATRFLFKPIQDIDQGVKRFGDGNLTHRIPKRRNDQLGELTDSVNSMAADISNMLEAKRQLLLGISHELRSPLTRSRVNLELVEQSAAKSEIIKDIDLMDQLITELLESERLNSHHSSLTLETVRVDHLIEEIVAGDFTDRIVAANLNPITAQIDPLRIKLLIRNLIRNAVAHNRPEREPPAISLISESHQFRLMVEDFGIGIERKYIPFLTEPFYRADPSRQRKTGGYGLGLYLCRMIVQAHGGRLHIDSERHRGTRIICELPISREAK